MGTLAEQHGSLSHALAPLDSGAESPPLPLPQQTLLHPRSEESAEIYPLAKDAITTRNLEFLRGAAAFYVLLGHTRGHLFAGGSHLSATRELHFFDYLMLGFLQLTSMGTEAVILFFVLSGYAMAHSVRHSASMPIFYAKRFIRIFPAYCVAVLIAFAIAWLVIANDLSGVVENEISKSSWNVEALLLMLSYIKVNTNLTAQFWSLPHEVMFYAIAPFILATIMRTRWWFGIAALCAVLNIIFFGIYDAPPIAKIWALRQFMSLLVFFMCGAVAYDLRHKLPRIPIRHLVWAVPVYFVILWIIKYRLLGGWNSLTSLMTIPLAVVLITSVPARLSSNRWLNWGHFSYSLYIIHMQLIILIALLLEHGLGITQRDMSSYWMWLLAVPPVVGISWVFYWLVERQADHLLRIIRRGELQGRRDPFSKLGVHSV